MAKREKPHPPFGKFHVTISDDAHILIPDPAEAELFVRYALMAFKEEPTKNTFALGKLKLVCVIDGNEISIITDKELKEILGK